MYTYLLNRTQRIKINNNFSDTTDIEFGVPQGSVLGPLLFSIDMIDLFYRCEDFNVTSYADDTTTHSCATDIPIVTWELHPFASKFAR